MTGCAAVGAFGIMLVEPRAAVGDADPTFDGSSERYPFLYETLSAKRPIRTSNLITGSSSQYAARFVKGSYVPSGAIGFQLGPVEYDLWLPRLLGANESANVFALSEALPLFDIMIHRDNDIFYGRNCSVAAGLFHVKSGNGEEEDEILNLQIRIICREIDLTKSWPGSVPTLTNGEDYTPYTQPQGVFKINGTEYDFDEAQILIDNGLRAKTRANLTPNCVYKTRRRIRANVVAPFTEALWTACQSLYNAGDDVMLRWETGTGPTDEAIQFDFPSMRIPLEDPVIRTHDEIPLNIAMDAGATSALNELTVTNIS